MAVPQSVSWSLDQQQHPCRASVRLKQDTPTAPPATAAAIHGGALLIC